MATLTAEQRRNAQVIISVGRSLGASNRDILVALMTALQESGLRNVPYGDRDSVGLFQQRAGWGSYAMRMNPTISARMFFVGGKAGQRGLLDIANRGTMRLTAAAQAVQRSAFPNAYAKHESTARSLMGASGGAQYSSAGFIRPVRGGSITSDFGPRRGGRGISTNHHGLDIGVPVGTPVYAAAAGRIVRVTTGGNYGTRVEIAHEGKVYTLYAHLSRVDVRVGQQVMQGQLIARSGGKRGAYGSGNATGPHLHFEVRTGSNRYGNARDPMGFLNQRTTPSAYLDDMVVAPDMTQYTEAEPVPQALNLAPYVYQNPIDQFTDIQLPIDEDPIGSFGSGLPLGLEGETEFAPPQLPEPGLVGAGLNEGMI